MFGSRAHRSMIVSMSASKPRRSATRSSAQRLWYDGRTHLERQHPGRRWIGNRPAEQVLEPALVHVGIGLEIEEQIAGRGRGRHASPRPGATGSSSCRVRCSFRPAELDARLLADTRRSLPSRRAPASSECGSGSTASVASVRTSRDCSSRVCSREIPATRLRWSSACRCRSHFGHQRQISQCGTGSG